MNLTMRKDATAFGVNTSARFDHARIRALIDEATTDSNDESDEYAGLLSMIQEEVVCPFLIRVSGRGCRVRPIRVAKERLRLERRLPHPKGEDANR